MKRHKLIILPMNKKQRLDIILQIHLNKLASNQQIRAKLYPKIRNRLVPINHINNFLFLQLTTKKIAYIVRKKTRVHETIDHHVVEVITNLLDDGLFKAEELLVALVGKSRPKA